MLEELLERVRLLPDQLKSISFSAARASRTEMESVLHKVRTWTSVGGLTEADEQFMESWASSANLDDVVEAVHQLYSMSESYSLWHIVRELDSIQKAWRAVQTGRVTAADISQMLVAYDMASFPMTIDTIRQLLLRHLVILPRIGHVFHTPRG